MQVNNLNKKLLIFISFNIFYAIFYLHYKHHVGNDTSISEWLINYQGGFTRRGLGGEINILLANYFSLLFRDAIFFSPNGYPYFIFIFNIFLLKEYKIKYLSIFCFIFSHFSFVSNS